MTMTAIRQWWKRHGLDRADVLVLVGLLAIAAGFWEAWRPGSFLVPGLVLVFYALPTRPPFIAEREPKGRR